MPSVIKSLFHITCFVLALVNQGKCQPSLDSLPKVELHLHLDCSLSYDVVKVLSPGTTPEEYRNSFIAPPKCANLADYITRAVRGVDLMQTREQLRLVTLDLFKQLKADRVVYAEIRFAPLLHTQKGLSPEEIVATVNKSVDEGTRTYGVDVGIILCTLRHFSEAQSMETVELVQKFKGTHVVGFDIAADEAGFPIDNHVKAFAYAQNHGLNCTAHAGEAKGPESVWETLQNFHPKRIGHGVRSLEDTILLDYLKRNNIHLEVCPTSNIQTNVFPTIRDHSVDRLYGYGISVGINTDARTISDVTLCSEYRLLQSVFHWDIKHFKNCNLEAIEHSFAPENIKQKVKKMILLNYQ